LKSVAVNPTKEGIPMPTIKLTKIICQGATEPLPIDFFLDNNTFQPSPRVQVNGTEPIPLNLEANYFTDSSIIIYRDNVPILQSMHSFTLLDQGQSGNTSFFAFQIQDSSYDVSVDYEVS
jgi:hypothetical protein